MNCHEFEHWLQRLLDGEARPLSPEADHHLTVCPDCRAQHGAAGLLLGWARTAPRPRPRADFNQQVAVLVLEDRVRRRRRFRTHVRITMALAASLLLVYLGVDFWFPSQRETTGLALNQTLDLAWLALPEQAPVALAHTMDQASRSVAALTGRLAETTRAHAWHMLAAAVPGDMTPSQPQESMNPGASLLQVGQNVSEGSEPLTRSAQRALNKWVRDLAALDVSGTNQ